MDFTKKILELRNKAQETQAANKIIDMLNHLEAKNDRNTSYRWIWELIQNAKDVTNSSGKVDILINFDELNKIIEFKHNGKLFSTKNIIFLIEQVSTKERGKIDEKIRKTTGKFGTGFLTTHLLSKKVNISGYLQDDDNITYSFNIYLDRSSTEQAEIIKSIEESCKQLDKSATVVNYKIKENDFNTCFTYVLDSNGIKTAKSGLNNLIISAPYVFAFVPEINSITVSATLVEKQYHQTFTRGDNKNINLDNAKVESINVITNGKKNERHILTLKCEETSDLAIAVELEFKNDDKLIKPTRQNLPKIFCDFPLLGTDDFSFPVVINSADFNPTEPRDGIYLTNKEFEDEEPLYIKENKNILFKAAELYITLLEYFLSYHYKGIYNITKLTEPITKEWLSVTWLANNIIDKLKLHIQEVDLIDTHSGIRKPLQDIWGNNTVLIPNHQDYNIRNKLWNLSSKLVPQMIPKYEELEYWYNSLWDTCHNYGVEDLIAQVEDCQNINTLMNKINGNVISWLNEFYELVYTKEYDFASKLSTEPRIIPNQTGDFDTLSSLHYDYNIEEIYKDISQLLNIDVRSKLIDKRVAVKLDQKKVIRRYKFEDLVTEIQMALKFSNVKEEEFYKKILCLKSVDREKQCLLLSICQEIYFEDSWITNTVVNFSNELFDLALDFWVKKICNDVCDCGSIKELAKRFYFDSERSTIDWLSKLIDYVLKQDKEHLLNQISVVPNQNGDFKMASELNLDSGEIEEVIKDVCEIAGYNIRDILLLKDIFLKLPKNRTIKVDQFADRIINYIRANKNKLGNTSEEKTVFQHFYTYLREHRSEEHISIPFNELCSNLHWFYNDDDIAENMHKVEEYRNILSKYGVLNVNKLEEILSSYNEKAVVAEEVSEQIVISKELLAQWGISTQEELERVLANNILDHNFVYTSTSTTEMFNYAKEILERSKNNILKYLSTLDEYDVENAVPISNTIFIVKKNDEEVYIITRPSDYNQIIIYYDSEVDTLDYQKDCELWIEDGNSTPEKITFGKILRLTGVNKIPLRRLE